MTLILKTGVSVKSIPRELSAKGNEKVFIDGLELSVEDLLRITLYALTNTSVFSDKDPKNNFINLVKQMTLCEKEDSLSKSLNKKKGKGKWIILKGDERMPVIGYSFIVADKL